MNKGQLIYPENYGYYAPMVEGDGTIEINTSILNKENVKDHFQGIYNILCDGIELDFVHGMYVIVTFVDNETVKLSIIDYMTNLILWQLPLSAGDPLTSEFLYYQENMTTDTISEYINEKYIYKHYKDMDFISLNQIISDTIDVIGKIDNFSHYFMNTINNEDTINLMKQNQEFYDCVHADLSGVPIEQVKDEGMRITNRAIEIIKESDHCMADNFRAKEGINNKQFREFMFNIGTKPDGKGGVYPVIINSNYSNEGLKDIPSYYIDSSIGRLALIIAKNNVGDSGHFSRILRLNNRSSKLHKDPNYACSTKNLIKVEIRTARILNMYKNRYYRFEPNGVEHKVSFTPLKDDMHLIGKTVYFRSPMTCSSAARGEGICYKCYGDLAYINRDINIGIIAAELLCSVLTQKLLSAKHLLESAIKSITWPDSFSQIFDIAFNAIGISENLTDLKKWNLIISSDDIMSEDEYDIADYNFYVNVIKVQNPDGDIIAISPKEDINIYLSSALTSIINIDKMDDNEEITIPFSKIKDEVLFLIHIDNNELSATLMNIKNMINRTVSVRTRDKDQMSQDFLQTIIDGGIGLDAIHAEIILSNMIRSDQDILEMPNWDNLNETYNILTLNEALINNPSITTSLQYQEFPKTLYRPLSFRKVKAASIDLFFMVNPQEWMNIEMVEPDISKDSEDDVKPAFSFEYENAFGKVDEN